MKARWGSRTFLGLGVPILVVGLALFVWEHYQSADIELIAAPVLLVGLLLLFEGYLARRRERVTGDNAK
jgi:hypothetical protein